MDRETETGKLPESHPINQLKRGRNIAQTHSRTFSRKNFLANLAAAGMMLFLGKQAGIIDKVLNDKPIEPEETTSTIIPEPTPEIPKKNYEQLSSQEKQEYILSLGLDDPERKEYEQKYVEDAHSLDEIDRGFCIVYEPQLRANLLSKRWELRFKADSNLPTLENKKVAWALSEGIHPEVLAISEEAYAKAKMIIAQLISQDKASFRPDLLHLTQTRELPASIFANLNAENIMPNPGAMAKLICTETGLKFPNPFKAQQRLPELLSFGFSFIGSKSAFSMIKPKYLGEKYLQDDNLFQQKVLNLYNTVAGVLKKATGLDFVKYFYNIPGSQAGEGDQSGGAIGIQMMPDVILEVQEDFEKYGLDFNPLDPVSSTIGAYIFLARGQKVGEEEEIVGNLNKKIPLFRFGYLKGEYIKNNRDVIEAIRIATFNKWNPHKEQVRQIINAANSFWDKILKK